MFKLYKKNIFIPPQSTPTPTKSNYHTITTAPPWCLVLIGFNIL